MPGIVVNCTTLERADTVKLLGVQLSNDLSWDHQVEFIVKKAQSRLFFFEYAEKSQHEGQGYHSHLVFENMTHT